MAEVAVHTDYKALYEESQLAVLQLRMNSISKKNDLRLPNRERFMPVIRLIRLSLSMGLASRASDRHVADPG